jgi:hypothetical protein
MTNKEHETQALAQHHYDMEQAVTDIFELEETSTASEAACERISLLEVNENTIPSGIVPIPFDPLPASGIHFPSIIVEVTPEEFARIQRNELSLPKGWRLGSRIPRKDDNGGR